jgi:hypothetical protein
MASLRYPRYLERRPPPEVLMLYRAAVCDIHLSYAVPLLVRQAIIGRYAPTMPQNYIYNLLRPRDSNPAHVKVSRNVEP